METTPAQRTRRSSFVVLAVLASAALARAQSPARSIEFRRVPLSSEFFCEGASFADFDKDGAVAPADIAGFVNQWFASFTTGGCP